MKKKIGGVVLGTVIFVNCAQGSNLLTFANELESNTPTAVEEVPSSSTPENIVDVNESNSQVEGEKTEASKQDENKQEENKQEENKQEENKQDGDDTIEAPVLNEVPQIIIETADTILSTDEFNPMEGVTATDKEDGDITSKIKIEGSVDTTKEGKYTLTYTVEDSQGARTTIIRVIEVIIPTFVNKAPKIIGADNKTIEVGTKFDLFEGVKAEDFEEGNITRKIKIDGTVNVLKPGTYKLVYTVQDLNKGTDTVERIITVVPAKQDKPQNTTKPSAPNKPQSNNSVSKNNPKTSDAGMIGYIGATIASTCALFLNRKKK